MELEAGQNESPCGAPYSQHGVVLNLRSSERWAVLRDKDEFS